MSFPQSSSPGTHVLHFDLLILLDLDVDIVPREGVIRISNLVLHLGDIASPSTDELCDLEVLHPHLEHESRRPSNLFIFLKASSCFSRFPSGSSSSPHPSPSVVPRLSFMMPSANASFFVTIWQKRRPASPSTIPRVFTMTKSLILLPPSRRTSPRLRA